jgi:hypothetical protein
MRGDWELSNDLANSFIESKLTHHAALIFADCAKVIVHFQHFFAQKGVFVLSALGHRSTFVNKVLVSSVQENKALIVFEIRNQRLCM